MKICICTTPIRPEPTRYPPFGSLAIIQALRNIGESAQFYNIDFHRYSRDEVREYFRANQFGILGISAVVSTAYAYTKFLAETIRAVSPHTKIIVGGSLAASAEILLRKAAIDFCIVGDGELIIQDLVRAIRDDADYRTKLGAMKGVCYLDDSGRFMFNGYGSRPSAEEIPWPDYGILEADGSFDYFVTEDVDSGFEGHKQTAKRGERVATVVMAKGCVARCTFCHRFEKGYRPRPSDQILGHIQYLRDHHNVRFVDVADENFGSDREQAWALASNLSEMGIIWTVAGVRTRTVTRESLAHWKANGCVSVIYGVESGSQKMLDVMEKNSTVKENENALLWASELGLQTIVQLVIGMPGETDETIEESIGFLKRVSPHLQSWKDRAPSEVISINYAQALPGTPLYEYARERGYIGKTVDEEEQYLIRISDIDAYAEDHFINHTGYPMLKVLMWRPLMLSKLDAFHLLSKNAQAHLSVWQIVRYYFMLVAVRVLRRLGWTRGGAGGNDAQAQGRYADYAASSGYFNIHSNLKFSPLLLNPVTERFFYPLLAVAIAFYKSKSLTNAVALLYGHIKWNLAGGRLPESLPSRSLRKVVTLVSRRNEGAEDRMLPLRSGR